ITSTIIGSALALTVTTARAAEDIKSANYILPYCKAIAEERMLPNTAAVFVQGQCTGIVFAIHHMFWLTQTIGKIRTGLLCADIPDQVTLQQEIRVVVKYIEAHPKDAHADFRELAL